MAHHAVRPPSDGLIGMPVGKDGIARPDRADVLAPIWVAEEDTSVISVGVDRVIVGRVVRVRDVDRAVHDGYIMLSSCM